MAFKFFHSKRTLACILHGIKDACDQGFNVKKRKKKQPFSAMIGV